MSVLDNYLKDLEEDFYLRNTTYLMQIGEKSIRDELTGLYNSKDIQMMTLATVINAIYTDGKPTFFLSTRTLSHLLSGDKNLSYKGRRGISVSEHRQAYAKVLNYFREKEVFQLNFEASAETKMPMCVSLVDEDMLRSMGDQMMIKLASNWHQTVIKTRQAMESNGKSGNFIHDNVNVKVNKREKLDLLTFQSGESTGEEVGEVGLGSPEEGLCQESTSSGLPKPYSPKTISHVHPEDEYSDWANLEEEADWSATTSVSPPKASNVYVAAVASNGNQSSNDRNIVSANPKASAHTVISPSASNESGVKFDIKAIVATWKASYGEDLSCAHSKHTKTSIPELVQTIYDYGHREINANRIADQVFGRNIKSNLKEWKDSFISVLDEAWTIQTQKVVLSQPKSKSEYRSSKISGEIDFETAMKLTTDDEVVAEMMADFERLRKGS